MQTRLLVECRTGKEVIVRSSTVYSCDFHEGRQHFITLLMFVLNFVLFLNVFTLVIFMKVDNIVDVCVEFCFILFTVVNISSHC